MERFFYFADWTIAHFLRERGFGSRSKDYELVAAVITNRMCERQWGERCEIGFPINSDAYRLADTSEKLNLEQLTKILRNEIEEDSPVDYAGNGVKASVFTFSKTKGKFRDWVVNT